MPFGLVDDLYAGIPQIYRRNKEDNIEVAAGYSHIVIKALEADAKRVFANDIVAHQLQIINILSAAAVRESAHLFARKIS